MKIVFRPAALKALDKLPKRDAVALSAKIAAYAANPAAATNVKALQGVRPPMYRLRHGDWRALFAITDGEIVVEEIKHRREAYR